jgi:hypothetical protein
MRIERVNLPLRIPSIILIALGFCQGDENTMNFGGRVVDAPSQAPVASARVILEIWSQPEPLTTFTNSSGLFSFTIAASAKVLAGRILVYDTDHVRLEQTVEVRYDVKPQEIVLERIQPFEKTQVEPRTDSVTVSSFAGSNWSNWFDVCSRPLQPNERIGDASFRLSGDRGCASWGECRESVHQPGKECWQFRIQGHSEWSGPFGSILANRVGQVIGQLNYSVVRTQETRPSETGIPDVWIQFAGKTNAAIIQRLVEIIGKNGWRVAGVERIDKTYPSRVKFFHDSDVTLAGNVLKATSELLITQKGLALPTLEDVQGQENKARSNQVEVWLNKADQ